MLVTALLTMGLAGVEPAQAKTLVLKPSSPWNMDYAEDSCALRRTFGQDGQRTVLELRRFAPEHRFQTIVATSATKLASGSFKYRFGPDEKWHDPSGWHHVHLEGDQGGVIFNTALVEVPSGGLSADDFARQAKLLASQEFLDRESEIADKVTDIAVMRAFRDSLVLETGSLKAPLEAMRKCIDELRLHWGIDVKAHETLTRAAVPINRASVPRMMDYPPKMLVKRMPGLVNIRLDIDDKGGITACHIQMPLADPAFEKSSCADLQHALEFEPALDKDGKPIASYWVTSVDFRIN